ncbi:MAG: porin [Plesiomonas sp.]|uniref:porin n=1 Tax=Plesiomonas sp. TaxID=2486279 RepID=UPI003F37B652
MRYRIFTVIAPAILLAQTAHTAEIYNKDGNQLNLYGYIMGDYHFAKENSVSTYGDQSNSRFGVSGTTIINKELHGFGHVEYNQPISNNQNPYWGSQGSIRLGYAGIAHETYGTLQYGHNWAVMYDIATYADMLPEFGEDTLGYFSEVSSSTPISPDSMFGTGRGAGLLQYRYSYSNFDLGLQYLAQGTGVQAEGGGISLQYTFADIGLTFGAAYNSGGKNMQAIRSLSDTPLAADFNEDNADMWAVGAKYSIDNIYLAAVYAETKNLQPYVDINSDNNFADATQAYFLVAQYTWDNGITPGIAYAQGKAKNLTGYGDQNYSQYIDLSITYLINANFNTYIDYKINLLDSNAYTSQNSILIDNVTAVAVQYTF